MTDQIDRKQPAPSDVQRQQPAGHAAGAGRGPGFCEQFLEVGRVFLLESLRQRNVRLESDGFVPVWERLHGADQVCVGGVTTRRFVRSDLRHPRGCRPGL